MDCVKVGNLIYRLRKEKNMTQKDVGDKLNISDKTISKWERGLGCPDISLLSELSEILGVDINNLLCGKLEEKEMNIGNMKRMKFYICKTCFNIVTSTNDVDISCCGRKIETIKPVLNSLDHILNTEEVENDYYITMKHEMSKDHYISFVGFVDYDKMFLKKLYPEQDMEFRMPRLMNGKFIYYCTQHGLFEQVIKRKPKIQPK